MKKIIFIILIFMTYEAQANRVGNGGNIVACEKGGEQQFQVLDLYESSLENKKFSGQTDAFKIAASAFDSFLKYDQKITQQYKKALENLKSDIEFKTDIEIVSSNDAKLAELPKDCKLIQIAIRKNQRSSIEKKFIFSKSYWDKLSPQDQAGMLMHEIVYDHFYKLGEVDSVKARKFVAYVMSEKIDKDSNDDVTAFVRSLKVPLYKSK